MMTKISMAEDADSWCRQLGNFAPIVYRPLPLPATSAGTDIAAFQSRRSVRNLRAGGPAQRRGAAAQFLLVALIMTAIYPLSAVAQMQGGGRQPIFRGSVRTGVPADLIRNRPDIRVAERTLAASTAQIGVAEAKLFPSITLSGSISPTYIHTSSASGGLTTWSFGPSLNLPIFDGGALRAGVKSAESTSRENYLAWQSTVRSAIEDVENALSAVSRDAQTVSALQAQVKSYQEALQLSTASYKDGASSLLDVLDAQRNVTAAQQSLAQAVQQSALDYISLNVNIGAGYVPASKATIAQAPAKAKVVKVSAKKAN